MSTILNSMLTKSVLAARTQSQSIAKPTSTSSHNSSKANATATAAFASRAMGFAVKELGRETKEIESANAILQKTQEISTEKQRIEKEKQLEQEPIDDYPKKKKQSRSLQKKRKHNSINKTYKIPRFDILTIQNDYLNEPHSPSVVIDIPQLYNRRSSTTLLSWGDNNYLDMWV